MRLERLILNNFLTYDHLDYMFERRPLLVQGRNLTDSGQASNGSGKSGLQTGIEYCITATNSRDVRDNEIISYGFQAANAQLFAVCDVRKERIHIDWDIRLKSSNKLNISLQKFGEDEWSDVSFSNVNDGKKYIQTWFAISKEDLFNYFIINNTRFKSFFKSSNKEKVDLINRFSDASIVDGLEKIDTSELETKYSNQETEISKLRGKVELTQDSIEAERKRDFKTELLEEAKALEEDIEDLEGDIDIVRVNIKKLAPRKKELEKEIREIEEDISDSESSIKDHNKTKDHLNEELEVLEESIRESQALVDDFNKTDFEAERSDYEGDLESDEESLNGEELVRDELDAKETKLLTFLKGLEVKLSGAIVCPKCSHEFLLDGDIDELKSKQSKGNTLHKAIEKKKKESDAAIKLLKDGIKSLESSLSEINKREEAEIKAYGLLTIALNKIKNSSNTIEAKISSEQRKIDKINKQINDDKSDIKDIELEIKGLSQSRSNYKAEIENLEKEISVIQSQIKALKPGNNESAIKGLEFELSAYEKDIESRLAQLQEIGDEIYMKNQWANNFKQFRMYLANQSLEAIEFHCNRYLSEMGGDLVIKLEGYKTLANGSVKDEITAKIVRNVERSFSSFSGGERGRLLFASILANRHMINQTHPYGGLDFLSVDEVFEGVDGVGLKYLISSAKKLEVTAMIITHVTDEETSQDILLIEKQNGVSRIVK